MDIQYIKYGTTTSDKNVVVKDMSLRPPITHALGKIIKIGRKKKK